MIPPEAADKEVKDRQWMWYARRQDVRARLRRAFSKEQAAPDPDEREIFEDRSARAMATDAASLLERLHSKEEVLCAYTTAIVVMPCSVWVRAVGSLAKPRSEWL